MIPGLLQAVADEEVFSGFDYRAAVEDALDLELQRFHKKAGGSSQFVGPYEGDSQLDDMFKAALGQTPAILFRVSGATGAGGTSSRKQTKVQLTVEVMVFSNDLSSMERRQRRTVFAILAELRSFLIGRDIKSNTEPFVFVSELPVDRGDRGGSLWVQQWQSEASQERGFFPDSGQALESIEARNEMINSNNAPATRVTTLAEI